MKTIIHSILAIFIFGIIAMGFTTKPDNTRLILIQSTDSKMSQTNLSRSAEIITNRLKNYSTAKFEIAVIPGKNQIQLTLNNSWDLKIAEQLATQKGSLEFYETYNYKGVSELLKGDGMLLTLLNGKVPGDTNPQIGCTTSAGTSKVDKYVNAAGLDQVCKFVWNNTFEDSEVCLYALKLVDGKGVILNGADIESFKISHDSKRNQDDLNFSFKKSVIPVWADITKRNIGNAIAMVLDGKVIFAPVVRDEITGGNCTVSGGFTTAQVKYIVAIGSNGELPVSFKVVK